MIGNISLLFFSFLFICILTIYLAKVQSDLDIIDIYIIFVLLHFGFYPFVRGLYFGKDVIFDFRDSNPLVIGLIFIHVFLILLIIRFLSWYFPKNIANYLNIRNMIQQWSSINRYILLCIYVVLIVFQIISYYKYGIKTYILPDDFERIGKHLPYWFTSVRTIYPHLAFLVFLGLFSHILKSKGSSPVCMDYSNYFVCSNRDNLRQKVFLGYDRGRSSILVRRKEKKYISIKVPEGYFGISLRFFLIQ